MLSINLAVTFLVLLSTWALIPPIARFAIRVGWVDQPNLRKLHSEPIPSTGGLVFIPLAFLAWLFTLPNLFEGQATLLAGSVVIFLVGAIDDVKPISHRLKFPVQFAISLMIIHEMQLLPIGLGGLFGIYQVDGWLGYILLTLFFVFTINAFNFADGVNGLLGSFSFVSLGILAFLLFKLNMPARAWLLVYLGAGLLGFLYFNFRNQAVVFMGDGGSTVLGLITAVGVASFIQAKPVIQGSHGIIYGFWLAVLLFWYPLLDTLQVFLGRLIKGKSPFHPDKTHVHHQLMTTLDWGHLGVSFLVLGITGTFSLAVLYLLKG
jgi:UDP-GlcNAc:undecaprenyl-phosphate GlcNAc-1-phosphate transferase